MGRGPRDNTEAVPSDSHFCLLSELPPPVCGPLNHVAQESHEVAEGDSQLGPGVTLTTGPSHPLSPRWCSGALCRWEASAGAQGSGRPEFLSKCSRVRVASDLGQSIICPSLNFLIYKMGDNKPSQLGCGWYLMRSGGKVGCTARRKLLMLMAMGVGEVMVEGIVS